MSIFVYFYLNLKQVADLHECVSLDRCRLSAICVGETNNCRFNFTIPMFLSQKFLREVAGINLEAHLSTVHNESFLHTVSHA